MIQYWTEVIKAQLARYLNIGNVYAGNYNLFALQLTFLSLKFL